MLETERDIDEQLTPEAWATIGKNMHATSDSVRKKMNKFNLETCLCSFIVVNGSSVGGKGIRQ